MDLNLFYKFKSIHFIFMSVVNSCGRKNKKMKKTIILFFVLFSFELFSQTYETHHLFKNYKEGYNTYRIPTDKLICQRT